MTAYTLIRSRRKTVALRITKNAELEVRAPLKMPKEYIDKFVASKQDWISKNLAASEHSLKQKAVFSLNYGDMVSFLGKRYPIEAKAGKHAGFDGERFYLPLNLPHEEIRRTVIKIYKQMAKRVLTNKVIDYGQKMDLMPTAVKISSAKTRWGSCSGKDSINFSWYLVIGDDYVIDYVVVHELAHIKEHNHSQRFWSVVSNILPDYVLRQKKLKELQKLLSTQDWE